MAAHQAPVPGILQARTLEWVAISFSNAWKWKVKVKSLSHVRLFATPWTAAHQVPPSMGFSRQEYWSGLPLPSPSEDLAKLINESGYTKQHSFNIFSTSLYSKNMSSRIFTFTFHFHALEKEMATHSSVLAWRIPGTGKPDGLLSVGSHRVGHDWSDLAAEAAAGSS